ncbi:hypothetical protein CLK_A0169 (plasmid) [Clostridium botulinum A3 str. Loch Maree]|uniref:hypothetical protein n=1 Tax=Clostridium botulinum TaxID=1491 RepID=UPI00016DBAA1|nr:hypothetical protein [Clostridium botulinum]ACA57336.1 hypothetical protein CLK_A0169 [Clostridium botulinum A3 str. Loch Maree]
MKENTNQKWLNADMQLTDETNTKQPSCQNCRWVGCRNYGWNKPVCNKYIKEY